MRSRVGLLVWSLVQGPTSLVLTVVLAGTRVLLWA